MRTAPPRPPHSSRAPPSCIRIIVGSAYFRLCGAAHNRKNHYGSRSERGTRVAALCYTLLESAKLAGIEPAAYLAEATRRAIATPGTVTLSRDFAGA